MSENRIRRTPSTRRGGRLDELLRLRAHVDAEIARARDELALTARDDSADQEPAHGAEEDLARVAEVLYVRIAHLQGRSRHSGLARRRHLAAWLLRQLEYSLPRIGRALQRDHSTILHSIRVVENDPELLETATALLARVQAGQ